MQAFGQDSPARAEPTDPTGIDSSGSGDSATFHGITREISFPVIPKRAGHKINVRGGFDINLSDYKVPRPALLGVAVKDKLAISFDLWAPEE